MIAHPNKLLFGIGSVHEDSPYVQRKYNFTIGADKADKSGNFTIKQQIDTTDVAFISFFMRLRFNWFIANHLTFGYTIQTVFKQN